MQFLRSFFSITALVSYTTYAQAPSGVGAAVKFGDGGTYPRATRLADGSLLGIYTHFAGGNKTITTVKSTDNGASWSPIGVVDTGPSATRELDNGFVHQLPSGRVLAAFRNHDPIPSGGFSFYRLTVCYSDDQGNSWKYLSTPVTDPAGPTGDWEPFMQQALDGSLQFYYSHENSNMDQDSILKTSGDGGQTWSNGQTISGAGITARDGMVNVARIAENSPVSIAIFESGNTAGDNLFTVHTVRSDDDGKTWGNRALVYASPGHNVGAPGIIRVGTRLVASFATDEDGGVWPNGAVKIMVSLDQGRTWNDKTTVHALPAIWAGLVALDDNSFLALYDSGGSSYAQKMAF